MEIKGRIKDLCKAPSRAVRLFGGHLHMLFFFFFKKVAGAAHRALAASE